MDGNAKIEVWDLDPKKLPVQGSFPLEPIVVYVGHQKVTSGKGDGIRFWVHIQLAKKAMFELSILSYEQFEEVD